MDKQTKEQECVDAFKGGEKDDVERLLPDIQQPATIRTTFMLNSYYGTVSLVSLLHLAAYWGWRNVVTALVSVYICDPNCKDEQGHIPLHYAATNGHLEVVKYFIDVLSCDPGAKNNSGTTILHKICRHGHVNIAQYLIREKKCNPSCEDNDGRTPLHYACMNGQLNIAQYFIREEHCNPSCEDKYNKTPLHFACDNGYLNIVQYLLSTGRVNPLTKDKYGITALTYASGKYDIIKLFEPFEECRTAFPVHTFTKLILTGDSGAGKTTITELIVRLASSTAVECVADVQRYTAGIVPHHIQSEQLGNFVMYDFAGQQEYYSSHDAVLEQVMRRSAAMFLCVVDLSESKEKICESLYYWLSFIDNACSTAEGRSHVVIIGSHADQVMSSVEEKSSLLQTIIHVATRRVRRQLYVECIAMDCRRTNTDASRRLIATLTNSQKAITASQPVIHYYSHVVYAFLRTKLNVVGCTLHDLVSVIAKENDPSLPSDQSVLTEILTTLSDKGLILFIRHHQSSWIVVKTEALLNKINGTLFAPDHFKEHRDLASNTGIVPVSNLHKVFPDYNSEMLVGFLTSLDFCRPVDPSVLQYTNLQTTPSHSTADILFFPGLVQSERPDSLVQQLGALEFGWCLRSMDPHEFLNSRFLHLLLLSVAYEFPLASRFNPYSSVSGLQRKCAIWRNGIFWRDDNNTCTVIELLDNNRCVMVAMSYTGTVEYAKLRGSLIALIRRLLHKHSPAPEVCEFLISPDLVRQYPIDTFPDTDLFDMCDVARSILQRKPVILSHGDGRGHLKTQSLPFEPYHLLAPSYVSQLFNPNMADQPVPGPLLQEVKQLYRHLKESLKVSELREHLDMLSLFAGRDPLVSSVAVL